jgi:hypothetical protein
MTTQVIDIHCKPNPTMVSVVQCLATVTYFSAFPGIFYGTRLYHNSVHYTLDSLPFVYSCDISGGDCAIV